MKQVYTLVPFNNGLSHYPVGYIFKVIDDSKAERWGLIEVEGENGIIFLRIGEYEAVDFEPSPIYNHVIVQGYTGRPEGLKIGFNPELEAEYLQCSNLSPLITTDTAMACYVVTDDDPNPIFNSSAKVYLKYYEFLEHIRAFVIEQKNNSVTEY